jgi:hypothetical protein
MNPTASNERTHQAKRSRARQFHVRILSSCRKNSPLARLQIEHVRPRKHGGNDDLNNLALACIDCNLRKSVNLTGIDPQTGAICELFNPRGQIWDEHFAWNGLYLTGISSTGRATVNCLDMNSPDQLLVRLAIS